jgi:hypothetical protein
MRSFTRLVLGLLGSLFIAACDEVDARFTTKFASDFAPSGRSASVLGVYKDGRMAPEGWEAFAPYLAAEPGASACDVGFNRLVSSGSPLADAIDEYARADGPTDDLLRQVAPAAKGDLILLLTFAGALPKRFTSDAGAKQPASTSPTAGGRGGRRGMGVAGHARTNQRSERTTDSDVLEVSASLYSVAQKSSVALIRLQYSGPSLNEALTKFAAKLARSLPRMRCLGWDWSQGVDPDRIRQSIDE